jgi:tripartite-type tricarboxylate transporter receptor subunit TctC
VGVLLNAVTGIRARIVVGFGNSARLKAVLAGDADFYTAATDAELQPLLTSQDVQALYTIVGNEFPPEVDRSRTLETFLVPGAPASVVDFIKAARGMGRAFFAPPGVSQEDLDALREIFQAVLTSPAFVQEAARQGVPVAAVTWGRIEDDIERLMPTDPASKQQLDHAYKCGLAMSDGSLARCDF